MKKSDRIKIRAKDFLALRREERELWKQKLNEPLVELEAPFYRGFERFFVPTKEALVRDDLEDFLEALDYFQNRQYCRKGLFEKWRWKEGKSTPLKHVLRSLTMRQRRRRPIPDRLLNYTLTLYCPKHGKAEYVRNREDCRRPFYFRFPDLVKSFSQRKLVTHLPLHDPIIEARLDEIHDILWGDRETGPVSKALGIRHRYFWDWEDSKAEKSAREDFRQQLDEANSDPTIRSAVSPRFFYVWIGRWQLSFPYHKSRKHYPMTYLSIGQLAICEHKFDGAKCDGC